MNKIESFTVDHIKLDRGVYVSRVDHLGQEVVTTFDLRMKKPNRELLDNEAIHTLEHLVATFVRNDEEFSSRVVYFGPMGCLTGMYLILHGSYQSHDIVPLLVRAFKFVVDFQGDIPGVSEIECGSYKLHSLSKAKEEAKIYLEVLNNIRPDQLIYPQ
ncbi:S-ribosylhomocysteine lyase [Fusibacter bizertensis]